MKKIISLYSFIPLLLFSQKNNAENIYNHWYFGAEVGGSKIASNYLVNKLSFQGGVSAEYYFSKQWSIVGKIKYFNTEVFYNHQKTPSTTTGWYTINLDLSGDSNPYNSLLYKGNVLSAPIQIKWEFRVYKNVKANLFMGTSYNFETYNHYEIPENDNPDTSMFPKSYFGFIGGAGLSYFIKDNVVIVFTDEFSSGGWKGTYNGFLGNKRYLAQNNLFSIGVKYSFK